MQQPLLTCLDDAVDCRAKDIAPELLGLLRICLGARPSSAAGTAPPLMQELDSLEFAEFVCSIEDSYDIRLSESSLAEVGSLAELVGVVRTLQARDLVIG